MIALFCSFGCRFKAASKGEILLSLTDLVLSSFHQERNSMTSILSPNFHVAAKANMSLI